MSKSVGHTPIAVKEMAQFTERNVMGVLFETTTRYQQLELVGVGISGLVCSARDRLTHKTVAIKKLAEPFKTASIAKYVFREVKLMKQLDHENIVRLTDVFISPSEDIYLVTDLMATDLDTLLKSKKIDEKFSQYFMYQIMRGLKYVHSAGVLHRDLKPSNILVNENCDLKICDFGLARVQEIQMTGYVSTRYYRAPEVMLNWGRYNEKVDIWSAGCIFAEMILGRPIFPGKNHIDQFCVIVQLLGTPPDNVTANVTNQSTLSFIRSIPTRPRKPLAELLPITDRDSIGLLEELLQFDPEKRCSAAKALEARYLALYHDPGDEPVAAERFDISFLEANLTADVWKNITYGEILGYHEQAVGSTEVTPYLSRMDLG
ncbi:hypothetical protein N7539_003230 [Penicillium diatomitis]|uniref:Mitogen-activated protein kinase n=1 Tax=Penicillium diatomitis TaxID=2819901 RepID=A0A9W9XH37_9EURO|nr:uncharacterized protein N7539_003230 [Penicillium diatomitis]KAJ5491663.1 hypothetical protein N7539_003230 [Penicillium diatomitis]